MTACFLSFFSEQRKKYSNSNIIMHETSQYHVQVSSKKRSPGFYQRNHPDGQQPMGDPASPHQGQRPKQVAHGSGEGTLNSDTNTDSSFIPPYATHS